MHRNSGLPAALFGLLAVIPVFAQQPKFDIADVHVSPTARTFAQNFGGVLREGRYVNRDATMLNLSSWRRTCSSRPMPISITPSRTAPVFRADGTF